MADTSLQSVTLHEVTLPAVQDTLHQEGGHTETGVGAPAILQKASVTIDSALFAQLLYYII